MQIKLGDFLREICIKTVVNNEYPVLTSSKNGIYLQSEYFNKQVASKDNTGYKIIKKGQFTYRAMSDTGEFYPNILKCVDIGIVSPAYPVFEITNRDIIYPQYLQYFFRSNTFRYNISGLEQGSTRTSIKFNKMKNIKIKLPPLLEQKKVIMILDRVGSLISKRQEQLKYFDELTKSLFIEMFGDIHNNKNYDYTNIEEITSVLSGGTPDRKENKYWEGGTINWVKTTELNNNIIIETEEKITNLGLENSSAKIIPPQSILIAMYGQGKTRGMTGYLEVSSATNQACACILPSRYINQKYLWNYLILSYDKLRSMAKGGNQPNLNVMIIKKFPVLIPPMNLQEKFVQSVSLIDKSKLAVKKSLEELEILKKSLMQKYFA